MYVNEDIVCDYHEMVCDLESVKPYHEIDTRLLHGAVGIATESGELLDQLKRHIYYGEELDVVNIKEELGDLLFYITLICNRFEWSLLDALAANMAKLQKRYSGGQFTQAEAIDRDAVAERCELEKETT